MKVASPLLLTVGIITITLTFIGMMFIEPPTLPQYLISSLTGALLGLIAAGVFGYFPEKGLKL